MISRLRFTEEEINYLISNCHKLTAYQMAKVINRTPSSIKNFFNRRGICYKKTSRSNNIVTHRELDVLRLMAKGFTNEEIGEELNISETTVKTHVSNIYLKLPLSGKRPHVMRSLAVLYYLDHKEELEGKI